MDKIDGPGGFVDRSLSAQGEGSLFYGSYVGLIYFDVYDWDNYKDIFDLLVLSHMRRVARVDLIEPEYEDSGNFTEREVIWEDEEDILSHTVFST
eukprot:snap_masked-scaffold_83-processed-gene-0.24-mRNA-1 protein AED:1.00 eAED:1.00 QI:0/0/0/0/1/1/2/0/94